MFKLLCTYFTIRVVIYYSAAICFKEVVTFAVQDCIFCIEELLHFVTKCTNSLVFVLHFASILKFCSITGMKPKSTARDKTQLKAVWILSPVMRFVSCAISQLIIRFMFDCEVKPGKKTKE